MHEHTLLVCYLSFFLEVSSLNDFTRLCLMLQNEGVFGDFGNGGLTRDYGGP